MINLLPRNRICSKFISSPVKVRPALSPPRSPLFLSNKFLLNADHRLCSPKRQSPALYSRLPISRSGARNAKTSSFRAKNFLQAPPISILRKSGFEVATFSEVWLLLAGAVADDRPGLSATGRSGEVAALVISLRSDSQSPLTSHPFDALRLLRAGLSPFTFHLSTIPQPLTSHQ